MKELSRSAQIYILGIILIGIGCFAWAMIGMQIQNLGMLVVLSVFASITHMLKVEGPTERSNYQISFVVYGFALTLLGPGQAVLVILVAHLVEWIWHRYTWYIQGFNIANFVVAITITGQLYILLNNGIPPNTLNSSLGILFAASFFTALNHFIIGLVLKLARGESFAKSQVFHNLPIMIDFTLFGLGTCAAFVWNFNPYLVIFILIPVYLIYSTLKIPQLKRESITDVKTGLYNMRYFAEVLDNELNRAKRFEHPLSVVMADLDFFRNINNNFGHQAGDEILIKIGKILTSSIRSYDVVARFGGEEFVLLMPETTPEDACSRVEFIRKTIESAEFQVSTSVAPIKITMSFGIAGWEGDEQTGSEIINNADLAVYQSKASGRNCTYFFTKQGGFQQSDGFFLPTTCNGEPEVELASILEAVPARVKTHSRSKVKASSNHPRAFILDLYISLLGTLAAILFLLTLQSFTGINWISLATFAAIVLIAEVLSIEVFVKDTSVSTSAAAILAGVLLFGPMGVLVLSLVQAGASYIKSKSRFNRFIFNASNQAIAGMICLGMLAWMGNRLSDLPLLTQIVLTVVASVLVYFVTTFLVTIAIHLNSGEAILTIWKDRFNWLFLFYVAMGLVAYAFIYSYQISGLFGVVVALVPLMMLRLSQKQYLDRTTDMASQLRSNLKDLRDKSCEVSQLNEALLMTLSHVIDVRDPFVLGHSQNVARYAASLGLQIGLTREQVDKIYKAGLLHDIGKLGIPESILWKPATLTTKEYETIRRHSQVGSEIIDNVISLKDLAPAVLHHHEKFDGSGYPGGLKGEDIPLEARILALADSVDAMGSDRPYRKALNLEAIVSEIQKCTGTQFDPQLVNAFLEILRKEGEKILINSAYVEERVLI